MATLAELEAQVRDLTGTLDPVGLPSDTIRRFINEAYLETLGGRAWPFATQTCSVLVAAGDGEPKLSDGSFILPVRHLLSARFDAGNASVELSLVSDERFASFAEDAKGVPRAALYNQPPDVRNEYGSILHPFAVVKLWPTPERAGRLTVMATVRLPELSASTDTPVFASEYHPMLAYAAAARILVRDADDSPRAVAYEGVCQTYAQRMVRDYIDTADRSPLVIGSGGARRRRSW